MDRFIDTLETPATALAVAAHPDDTEFGCSGLVAKWAAAGCVVHYLVLTSGDKGTENPDDAPAELMRIREAEQVAAAEYLGVKSCVFSRLGDGELFNSLELRGLIVREIRRFKPEVVLTWDFLTRNYRMHPDHRVCGQATLEAAFPSAIMPFSYPAQLRDEGLLPHRTKRALLFGSDAPDYYADISSVMDAKLQAMRLHSSQFNFDETFEERMRNRTRATAEGLPFEYAEAYKLVELG